MYSTHPIKKLWSAAQQPLTQYWSLLLLFPYLFISLTKWHYDIASPYSNFWSNSDSLGPLLWIKGDIFASDDTSWGRLVKATALPSLYAISYVLDTLGKTPFDFQKYIVFANVAISILLCVVIGKKLFKSTFLGLCLIYLFIPGHYISSLMIGYVVTLTYSVWSAYGAFSGILSMNLGVLILLLYICDYQWISIFLSVLLTSFHPSTGAIISLMLLACILIKEYLIEGEFESEKISSKTFFKSRMRGIKLSSLIKYLLLVLPPISMYLWAKVVNLDPYPKDFPWTQWWGWICGYVPYHVVPWRLDNIAKNYLLTFLLATSIAFFVYKKHLIRTYFNELVIIAISFLLVVTSFLSSELFHSYNLTSLYLHRGSAFGGVLLAVLICRLWSDDAVDDQAQPIAATTIILLTLPLSFGQGLSLFGFTNFHEFVEKIVLLEIIIAWIALAIDRFTKISKFWFPITILSLIILSLAKTTIVGVLGALLLSYHWFQWKKVSHTLLVIVLLVPLVIFLSPSYIEGLQALKQGAGTVFPVIADPTVDTRADIFRWLRFNTNKEDLIIDPPSNPHNILDRSVPSFGYNQLLSQREHLTSMKEFHVSVYIKSIFPITIRDVQDIFQMSDIYTCKECENSLELYTRIDDARLQMLANKHPRLKYFVRQKDVKSVSLHFPIAYENKDFAIHQLRS